MPCDPTLPAANSQISSAELRGQFTALKGLIDGLPKTSDVLDLISANSAALVTVTTLSTTVSNPPTQAQNQDEVPHIACVSDGRQAGFQA